MNPAFEYAVLTSPGIPSATILAHLLDTTRFNVKTVYIEPRPSSNAGAGKAPAPQRERWFSSWETLRCHVGLARAIPHHYAFKFLGKVCGLEELRFLLWCEERSPALFRRICGFPFPEELRGKKVLRVWDDVVRQYSLRVRQVENFNSATTLADLRQDVPDVILGLGTRILAPELLSIPRLGVLNAHSSLLPDYRGGGTEFWQLVGQASRTGVTIHWMAPKVDEGPICAQRSWAIPRGADHYRLRLMSLFYRLDLWRDTLDRLAAGHLSPSVQTPSGTRTYRRPSLRQQFEFYCRGIRPAAR